MWIATVLLVLPLLASSSSASQGDILLMNDRGLGGPPRWLVKCTTRIWGSFNCCIGARCCYSGQFCCKKFYEKSPAIPC